MLLGSLSRILLALASFIFFSRYAEVCSSLQESLKVSDATLLIENLKNSELNRRRSLIKVKIGREFSKILLRLLLAAPYITEGQDISNMLYLECHLIGKCMSDISFFGFHLSQKLDIKSLRVVSNCLSDL